MRYLLAAAEHRHFGRAAEELHLGQPALSQAIARLEREIGVPLLARTTRAVSLTPAGARSGSSWTALYPERATSLAAADPPGVTFRVIAKPDVAVTTTLRARTDLPAGSLVRQAFTRS